MGTNPSRPNPQLQQAQEMFKGLSRGRQVTLVAGVVGLIISFFPWTKSSASSTFVSASVSDNGWHGLAFIAVLMFILSAAWIILPLVGVQVRGILASLPPTITEARLVMGAGVIGLLCTVIFMLTDNPSGYSGPGVSTGPSLGAYLAILVSLAIVAGGYLIQQEPAA
jgi:hypothetical protein